MRQTLYDVKYKNSKVKVNSKIGVFVIFEDGKTRTIKIEDFFRNQNRMEKILRIYERLDSYTKTNEG